MYPWKLRKIQNQDSECPSEQRVPSEKDPCNRQLLTERETEEPNVLAEILTNDLN